MKLNFVNQNKLYLLFTLILVVLAAAFLYVWGLKLGIDFKGGTILAYKFETAVSKEDLDATLSTVPNIKLERISTNSDGSERLYFEPLSDDSRKAIEASLTEKYPKSTRESIESISASAAQEQAQRAFVSVGVASLVIIIFLTISFRTVPKPFSSIEFGIAAVVSLLHDALIVIGAFAILGHFFNMEVDTQFITAILTVIGFSVHDTIVVFDRVRENTIKSPLEPFKSIINTSLVETLARSLNLTVTALLVLICLFVLGPDSLKGFTLALIIGMFSGTYSSIFVATQLIILFQDLKKRIPYFNKVK